MTERTRTRWTPDELVVLHANHARGDSVEMSAMILNRSCVSVRAAESSRGLRRPPC